MFENVLSNLLTKLVFVVEKQMNTVSFVDVETTDKIYLSITVYPPNRCLSALSFDFPYARALHLFLNYVMHTSLPTTH
jgi:hypothetical protein